MAIEHDYFGLLETGPDGSIFWSESVELGDQVVAVDLTAPDEHDVQAPALDVAAAFISGLEELDARARNAMLAETDNRASEVTEYILSQQESYGEEIEEVLVDVSGDLPVDLIRSLALVSMTILADDYATGEPFAVMEYALDGDVGDEVLLVHLSADGTVHSVTSGD